jgi:cytochrome c oxidase assembly factor CtaG
MSSIYTYWSIDWTAFAAIALLCLLFAAYHEYKVGKWMRAFAAGITIMVLCFMSPLKVLSDDYLFSAHMLVHVLLLLVVGPLLVMSLHKKEINNKHLIGFSKMLFKKPVIGWAAGVGIMWFWHIPTVFNYGMNAGHFSIIAEAVIRAFESTSLIVAGIFFSWSIISPIAEYRLSPLTAVLYLFTACICCSLLGLLITFAPAGLYHHFLVGIDKYGLNSLIVDKWNINQSMDQQIAGLIMWVPCCLLYVVYALYLLAKWFDEKDIIADKAIV